LPTCAKRWCRDPERPSPARRPSGRRGASGTTASARGAALVRSHPRQVALASLVCGLAWSGALADLPGAETLALVAATVVCICSLARAPRLGLACGAALVLGAATGAARLEQLDSDRLAASESVTIRACLLEHPRPSPFGSSAEVEVSSGPATGLRLLARAPPGHRWPDGTEIGAELELEGLAQPVSAETGTDAEWVAHLERHGIAGEIQVDAARSTGDRRDGLMGALDAVRARGEHALAAGVSEPSAALIRGMVLGQDEAIDPLLRDDFRAAGLAHVLAVSGQNVVLLGLLTLPALGALGVPHRARLAILLLLIAAYVPLAGAGPSLQRAGVMGAAGLVAVAAGRATSRWYALLLAAVVTLAINPLACSAPGWQLSFAAVAGILVLGAPLRAALGGLPRPLADGAAVTVAATLATAPLLASHFEAVSVASLPANLLALPAVAPAMWIGMTQVAIAQLGALVGALEPLAGAGAGLLGAINEMLLDYISALATWFAGKSWAEVEVASPSPAATVAAYAAIGAVALAGRALARRLGPAATTAAGRLRAGSRTTRRAIAIAIVGAIVLIVQTGGPDGPPSALTVSFMDVGQGDATLVQHPDGGSILIDGGPVEARAYRLVEEAGVERLDLVIATHASADHHGGLLEVLEHIPVGTLLDGGDGSADPEFRAVLAEAEERGVRTVPAAAGQVLQIGALTVKVLAPEPRPPGPAPEDPNPRAVTTIVSAGDFDLLASGDAESPSLAALDLPDVDLLKVPHHGSSDEGLAAVLEEIRPEVAAIGVGEDNGYGHPAPSTLDALVDAGADVYRTDLDGTVAVSVAEGEITVDTEW
jgi:competence protein ComEC